MNYVATGYAYLILTPFRAFEKGVPLADNLDPAAFSSPTLGKVAAYAIVLGLSLGLGCYLSAAILMPCSYPLASLSFSALGVASWFWAYRNVRVLAQGQGFTLDTIATRIQWVFEIALLPIVEREPFVLQAQRLLTQGMHEDFRCYIIQTLIRIPANERETFVTQVLQLVSQPINSTSYNFYQIADLFETPSEDRPEYVRQQLENRAFQAARQVGDVERNINTWLPQNDPSLPSDRVTSFTASLNPEQRGSLDLFLHRIPEMRDFRNPNTQPIVKQRIENMLRGMIVNAEFKEAVCELLAEANASCADRLTEVLDQIEVQWHLFMSDVDDRKYIDILIGAERLNCLNKHVLKKNPGRDQIENILFYRLQLKEKLALPISTQGMLFRTHASVTSAQLQAAERAVLSETTDHANILCKSSHWQRRLEKRYLQVFEQVDEPFHSRLGELNLEKMTDGAYQTAMNAISTERKQAIAHLVAQLTQDILQQLQVRR